MRAKQVISELERNAIRQARKNGSTLKEIREAFHRGANVIREILASAPNSDVAPPLSPAAALVPVTVNGKSLKEAADDDALTIFNKALDSQTSNALRQELDHLIDATLRQFPHAHSLHIDLIHRKAHAEVAHVVELTVGGDK